MPLQNSPRLLPNPKSKLRWKRTKGVTQNPKSGCCSIALITLLGTPRRLMLFAKL
jgi:hypothetical protein